MRCAKSMRGGCQPIWPVGQIDRKIANGDGCWRNRAAHPDRNPRRAGDDPRPGGRRRPLCGNRDRRLIPRQIAGAAAPAGLSGAAGRNGRQTPRARAANRRAGRGLKFGTQGSGLGAALGLHICPSMTRPTGPGVVGTQRTPTMAIEQFIDNEVKNNDVVLFMKGTPQFPQCGFSGQVVQILDYIGVPYKGLNVLESDELRNGIKSYSNWPTVPQLYVKGEFVGGCDIVREMFQAGELQGLMKEKGLPVKESASA